MCRFAWLDFRWETASLEAVVRRQDGALLLRRERAEARLWVYHQRLGRERRRRGRREAPGALVLGQPVFDESAPGHRRVARKLSIFWVNVATALDRGRIADPMCGYRVYPIADAVAVMDRCGDRIDFDPEIAVRLRLAPGTRPRTAQRRRWQFRLPSAERSTRA